MDKYIISMEYIEKFRSGLRISAEVFDAEINDLIGGAQGELIVVGVHPQWAICETDPLITMAVSTYVKANFGLDNDDFEKYHDAFERQKKSLSMTTKYTTAPPEEE